MHDLDDSTFQRLLDGTHAPLSTLVYALLKRQPCLRYESGKNAVMNAIFIVGDQNLKNIYDAAVTACLQGELKYSDVKPLDFEYGDKVIRFDDYYLSFGDLLHWAKPRFPKEIPYKTEVFSSQKLSHKAEPPVVKFEIDTGHLNFRNETIKINTNTNQYDLCRLLFSEENKDLRSKFGTFDFQDALGGNEQGTETLREKMRTAHRHLNEKICMKTTVGDLISWENGEVFINPKYLNS